MDNVVAYHLLQVFFMSDIQNPGESATLSGIKICKAKQRDYVTIPSTPLFSSNSIKLCLIRQSLLTGYVGARQVSGSKSSEVTCPGSPPLRT
jgi:hypothetical protein